MLLRSAVLTFGVGSSLHLEHATLLSSSLRGTNDPCDVNMELPNPLAPEYLANVFDLDIHPNGSHDKFAGHEKRLEFMRNNIESFAASCRGKRVLKVLMDDGLVLNYFGMDFSGVYRTRYKSLSDNARNFHEMEADEDVNEILGLYYPTRVSKFMEKIDFPEMMSSFYINPVVMAFGLSTSELKLLRDWQRDGFVIIDQWPEMNMEKFIDELGDEQNLRVENYSALQPMLYADTNLLQVQHKGLSSLKPMLHVQSLMMRLSSAYLGSQAEVHSSFTMTLEPGRTKMNYTNGPWHVDGCGRRIKAWIYHNDVDDDTYPTTICAGTHTNHWFPTIEYFVGKQMTNKLNPEMVKQEFGDRVHKMVGKKGGGFLFDTNSVHGADMEGFKERTTTLIEMSTKQHMQMAPRRTEEDGYMSGWASNLCPAKSDR